MGHDRQACWSRDALLSALYQNVPNARYLPSRHDPDLLEDENEYPLYFLNEDECIVVLLKPSQGAVFLGHLSILD